MNSIKHHGRRALGSILVLLTSIVLITWAWNSAIPDLFALPSMHFKQAVGLTVLLIVVSFILHPGSRHSGGNNASPYHKKSMEG